MATNRPKYWDEVLTDDESLAIVPGRLYDQCPRCLVALAFPDEESEVSCDSGYCGSCDRHWDVHDIDHEYNRRERNRSRGVPLQDSIEADLGGVPGPTNRDILDALDSRVNEERVARARQVIRGMISNPTPTQSCPSWEAQMREAGNESINTPRVWYARATDEIPEEVCSLVSVGDEVHYVDGSQSRWVAVHDTNLRGWRWTQVTSPEQYPTPPITSTTNYVGWQPLSMVESDPEPEQGYTTEPESPQPTTPEHSEPVVEFLRYAPLTWPEDALDRAAGRFATDSASESAVGETTEVSGV